MGTIEKRSPQITKEKIIEDILENFNFDKCQSIMNTLNWEWVNTGIPTVDDLKMAAIKRIYNAIEGLLDKDNRLSSSNYYFSSSGGIKATAFKNRYGHLESVNLEFIVEDWQSDGD
jgi:hypothetical protein